MRRGDASRAAADERGFTLIELLVVVIIIGILAAIAIPVFLEQREKAWDSAMRSDLRNAAVIQESVHTQTGAYGDLGALDLQGFRVSDGMTFVVVEHTTTDYCHEISYVASGTQWRFRASVGTPERNVVC